jgi:hypothetical protein
LANAPLIDIWAYYVVFVLLTPDTFDLSDHTTAPATIRRYFANENYRNWGIVK